MRICQWSNGVDDTTYSPVESESAQVPVGMTKADGEDIGYKLTPCLLNRLALSGELRVPSLGVDRLKGTTRTVFFLSSYISWCFRRWLTRWTNF